MTILDTIAQYTKRRVAEEQQLISLGEMKERALALGTGNGRAFYQALAGPGMSFICEVKKASPSKGLIDPVFDYGKIAAEYEAAQADAVSVLTEPRWFLGSDDIFRNIRAKIHTPMLRKDFVVDEYQIWQARCLDADAILLICAILDTETMHRYLRICRDLGLSALVEAHDEAEIRTALIAGAEIIGVNNRNLKDFSVNTDNSRRLRALVPRDILFVAESGVKDAEDVQRLREIGADAVLIGETLMRAGDKKALLKALRGVS